MNFKYSSKSIDFHIYIYKVFWAAPFPLGFPLHGLSQSVLKDKTKGTNTQLALACC